MASRSQGSVLKRSVLFPYVDTKSDGAISDRAAAFDAAVAAFTDECVSAITVYPRNTDKTERFEPVRAYILKLLLFIGCDPDSPALGLLARVVEERVKRPEMSIKSILKMLSKRTGIAFDRLDRMAETGFDVNDTELTEKVSYLTETKPMSSKDIINDLAAFVRVKRLSEVSR